MRETGVWDVRYAVQAQYEREFLESHRAELEEHLMAITETVGSLARRDRR